MRASNAQYYGSRNPLEAGGDFITAPEVSQVFGELIGLLMFQFWQTHFQNQEIALVELGPGQGTLMQDFLKATDRYPDFKNNRGIHLVEFSNTLRTVQKETLKGYNPHWHDTLNTLPQDCPLFIIANEYFDCLPIEQWVMTSHGPQIRRIEETPTGLTFSPVGPVIKETSPQTIQEATTLAQKLNAQGGMALIIDYGYMNGEEGDTLQALKHHQFVSPLEGFGEVDITAHVDFLSLKHIFEKEGCSIEGLGTQRDFLRTIGIHERFQSLGRKASPAQQEVLSRQLQRLIHPDKMGTLFKVLWVSQVLQPLAPHSL